MHASSSLIIATLSLGTTAAAEPREPSVYVESGVMVGGDVVGDVSATTAVLFDGGYRIASKLWLHAGLAAGGFVGLDENTMSSSYLLGRIGIEGRGCVGAGMLCAIAGVDVGVRRARDEVDNNTQADTRMAAVPRVSLDLGGRHVRFRPSFELLLDTHGVFGGDASAAIAYVW